MSWNPRVGDIVRRTAYDLRKRGGEDIRGIVCGFRGNVPLVYFTFRDPCWCWGVDEWPDWEKGLRLSHGDYRGNNRKKER